MSLTGEQVLASAEAFDVASDVAEIVLTGTIAAVAIAALVVGLRNLRHTEDTRES